MGIQVTIDERAKEIIREKGNLLTISRANIENCCVPISDVMVQYRKPDQPEMFNEINTDDISLYVDKYISFKNEHIQIKHTGFGPFRSVRVEGVSYF